MRHPKRSRCDAAPLRTVLFRNGSLLLFACLALASVAGPAFAQPAPPAAAVEPDPEEEYEVEELVVTGGRSVPRGSVIGDIPPEITLGPREIRAAGVGSVAELLEFLEPQTQSGRGRAGGRPVTLVNGARISSFSEIRDLPTEAIVRVEILPEEVALKYGYRADQRVVNFVLRPRRFRAVTTEAGVTAATAGGRATADATANLLRIQREDRLQLNVKATRSSVLLERERDLLADPGERPFDAIGNVTAAPFAAGAEIDPALSALTGRTVSVAPLPASLTGAPSLGAFAQGGARVTDEGAYRSLLPESGQVSINAVLTRPLGEGVSATLNGSVDIGESESRLGLATSSLVVPAGNPFSPFAGDVEVQRYTNGLHTLRRTTDSLNGHLGLAVNGALSGWRWSFTGNADRADTRSLTENPPTTAALQAAVLAGDPTVNPFAPIPAGALQYQPADRTRSIVTSADAELVANGVLVDLPAGALSATLKAGLETRNLDSQSFRRGVTRSADLSRDVGRVQASFDLPLTSRRNDVLPVLGDLSANVNVALDELSDFGTLTTVGFGANWSPIQAVRVIASFTEEDGAPSIQQLGDPETATPFVRVFDFRRGETVEVTQITGGNPLLAADTRRVMKLGLTVKPFDETDLTFRADYTKARTRDVIASFPTATAEIEAAFPERFLRDADGRLFQVDSRPVNFQRQDREEVRWGFNYSKPLGPVRRSGEGGPRGPRAAAQPAEGGAAPAPGAAATPPAPREAGAPRGPGGGFGGPGGGGRGFGGGGRGGGALQFAVFHTVHITDEIFIRPGVPILDLLDGSAVGSGGGQPRHEVDVQAGFSKNGLGARLKATWQSGTDVRGALGGEDLEFSDLTTVGLRLFADLGQQPIARRHTWLRGARATLAVENLFDTRLKVRTASGATPISYQPDYLDPLGRTVRLSFRKLFF